MIDERVTKGKNWIFLFVNHASKSLGFEIYNTMHLKYHIFIFTDVTMGHFEFK